MAGADRVQLHQERRVFQIVQLKRSGLFDDDELERIVTRTRSLEYSLAKREKRSSDFLQFIKYLISLKELCVLRFQASTWTYDKEISVRKFVRDVIDKCELMFDVACLGVCRHDLRLRLTHVQFWTDLIKDAVIEQRTASSVYDNDFVHQARGQRDHVWSNILHLFGHRVDLWIEASRSARSHEQTTAILLRGLGIHPKSRQLWRRIFLMELRKIKRSVKNADLAVIERVFESAISEDETLVVKLAKMVLRHRIAVPVVANPTRITMDKGLRMRTRQKITGVLAKVVEIAPVSSLNRLAFKCLCGLQTIDEAEMETKTFSDRDQLEFMVLVNRIDLSRLSACLNSIDPSDLIRVLRKLKKNSIEDDQTSKKIADIAFASNESEKLLTQLIRVTADPIRILDRPEPIKSSKLWSRLYLKYAENKQNRNRILDKALNQKSPAEVVKFAKVAMIENADDAESAHRIFMELSARIPVCVEMVSAVSAKCSNDSPLMGGVFERFMWYKEQTVDAVQFWIDYLNYQRNVSGDTEKVYREAMHVLNKKHLVRFTNEVALGSIK